LENDHSCKPGGKAENDGGNNFALFGGEKNNIKIIFEK